MAVVPPSNRDAERAVLGIILRSQKHLSQISGFLTADCFYHSNHQLIYRTIMQLHRAGEEIDILTVSLELERTGALEKLGGRSFIVELAEEHIASDQVKAAARSVHECHVRRCIMAIGAEIHDGALSGEMGSDELVGKMVPVLIAAVNDRAEKGFIKLSGVIEQTIQRIDQIQAGTIGTGIKTGFKDLDKAIGGLPPGLVIIGGRPGWGKTSWMNCMADNMVANGHVIAFVSAEMRSDELAMRALCTRAKVDSVKVRCGELSAEEWLRLTKAQGELADLAYWIDDSDSIEVGALCARVSQLHHEHNVEIVFVDYLQRLTTAEQFQQRRLMVEYQLIQLTQLARILQIPVVVASQLNRTLELRGGNRWQDKRPKLADFLESGRIEADAHLVTAIFRPGKYIREKQKDYEKYKSVAEVHILKNRQGPDGFKVDLFFDAEHTRFEDMAVGREELPF